ncbi:hypothetical protein AMTRI_Chr06g196880 [Amborella trichopoda]
MMGACRWVEAWEAASTSSLWLALPYDLVLPLLGPHFPQMRVSNSCSRRKFVHKWKPWGWYHHHLCASHLLLGPLPLLSGHHFPQMRVLNPHPRRELVDGEKLWRKQHHQPHASCFLYGPLGLLDCWLGWTLELTWAMYEPS